MNDLIRRKNIKNLLINLHIDNISINDKNILEFVDELPTIEAVPVVHAEWINNGIPDSMLSKCSVCEYTCGAYSMNFCPNCGSRMDGKKVE